MKRQVAILSAWVTVFAIQALGSELGTSSRSLIPKNARQIIVIDYRTLQSSENAAVLRDMVVQPELRDFAERLRSIGIDPNTDVRQLVYAIVPGVNGEEQNFVFADGDFLAERMSAQMKRDKITPTTYRRIDVYPVVAMTSPNHSPVIKKSDDRRNLHTESEFLGFVDHSTLIVGAPRGLSRALDARADGSESLLSNSRLSEMADRLGEAAVWSVLDQSGTANLLDGMLGGVPFSLDVGVAKKHLVCSGYSLDLASGLDISLVIVTTDDTTATTLAWLIKLGLAVKGQSLTSVESKLLKNTVIDVEKQKVAIQFHMREDEFRSLLRTQLFREILRLPAQEQWSPTQHTSHISLPLMPAEPTN